MPIDLVVARYGDQIYKNFITLVCIILCILCSHRLMKTSKIHLYITVFLIQLSDSANQRSDSDTQLSDSGTQLSETGPMA